MRVRGNWISLLSWRAFSGANDKVDRSMARLGSGRRVNVAGDDAAGLAISQRIQGQFRGLIQANRNALDGLSLVQTAESTLDEIQSLLQRGRELSIQAANGTLTDQDRNSLQFELDQILEEVDRIADNATFNNKRLFTPAGGSAITSKVIKGLRTSWLSEAETLIREKYGLIGDSTNLTVVLEPSGVQSAWISGTSSAVDGRYEELKLHINLSDFAVASGTSGPLYNDRKIARALTLATMSRNSSYDQVDAWFKSGAADFIAGGDEQLKSALDALGGNAQQLVDFLEDALTGSWQDDGLHRAAAYVAVKFLDNNLGPGGMQVFFSLLQGNTLQDTLAMTYGSASTASFIADVQAFGAAFIGSLDLTDTDVGSIGGGDASTVIPDSDEYVEDPLSDFEITWPPVNRGADIILQTGANEGQTLTFSIPEVSTYTLDILSLNIVQKATEAMEKLLGAINKVTTVRADLGSVANRLEHTINANAQAAESGQSTNSRILDLDTALELTNLTRQQIMVSSSGAIMAQANTMRQHVNWLLKGMNSGSGVAWGT